MDNADLLKKGYCMKKLFTPRIIGAMLAALLSSPALADINNSDIYINNKTTKNITVSQPTKEEWRGTGNNWRRKSTQPVGATLTIAPGHKQKIASLGRDQSLYNLVNSNGVVVTRINFNTATTNPHTFESQWDWARNGDLGKSELKYNGHPLKAPIKQPGLKVHTYYVFPKLYHDVEMLFDDSIK